MPALQIGIAGAGIGGLAAAALLAGDGHSVTVFDQFDAPAPVGSGLVLQPVGLAVLDAIGAGDTIRALGAPLAALYGEEATTGRIVLNVAYGQTPDRKGLGIHRSALFETLLTAARNHGATLRPGHTVAARDGQRLVMADGEITTPFDLLIDASGASSPLSPLRARPLPYGAIWATVPWPDTTDLLPNRLTQRYRAADRMLGVLPIGALPDRPDTPLAAIFYSLRTDAIAEWQSTPFATWRAEALSLWPQMAPFLPDTLSHRDFTPARYTHGNLAHPVGPGLIHIGDAAHRASPQLGQGANMALLDAMALARALRQHHHLDDALRSAASARRWHIAAYQGLSAAFTPQYQSDSTWLPILRDRFLAPLSQSRLIQPLLTRLICGDLLPPMPALTPRSTA